MCMMQAGKIVNASHCKRKHIVYGQIGDVNHTLMQLPNHEFMQEIWTTRARFQQKFPNLYNVIHEYKKQRMLLDLDFWYKKPVPKRCEQFLEMEVYTLLKNIEEGSEEEERVMQICYDVLCEYLPNKYLK